MFLDILQSSGEFPCASCHTGVGSKSTDMQEVIASLCYLGDMLSSRKTLSPPGPGIEDLDLFLKERRPCWYGHVERSNCAFKTACHTGWWKALAREAQDDIEAADREGMAESGSSRLSTLMTNIPGDLV